MALHCHNLRSGSLKQVIGASSGLQSQVTAGQPRYTLICMQAKKTKYAPDMANYHGDKAWENYQTWDDVSLTVH